MISNTTNSIVQLPKFHDDLTRKSVTIPILTQIPVVYILVEAAYEA